MLRALPFVAILVLSIFCLVQAITSRDDDAEFLRKVRKRADDSGERQPRQKAEQD